MTCEPFPALRGETIYRNTGELSFETRPQEAGTYPVVFLEWVTDADGVYYSRVVNQKGRIEAVHRSLVSRHNI